MITRTVMIKAPCNFLVFGLGNDSLYWVKINRGGQTAFIEDNEVWLKTITKQDHIKNVYLVDYKSLIIQWREFLQLPEQLDMPLPYEVENEKWDVILVDGPGGWNDSTPGRMKSIYLASKLANSSTDVFIHDCKREVEAAYSDRFMKPENLKAEVEILRHYCIEH